MIDIKEGDDDKKVTITKYNKWNLIYDSKHSFYRYRNNKKKNANFSFKSKYSFLIEFYYGLEIFDRLDPQKRHTHTHTKWMYMIYLLSYIMSF